MLSIPEKGFLFLFLSVVVFYLGLTKFRIDICQNNFRNSKVKFFVFNLTLQCQLPHPVLIARILLRFRLFNVDRFFRQYLFNPPICIKNLPFNIISCTTTFNEVLSHKEIVLLMPQNSSGNMSADLVNVGGTASLTVTFYTTWDFRFLSKDDFRVDKQVLSFLVGKMI